MTTASPLSWLLAVALAALLTLLLLSGAGLRHMGALRRRGYEPDSYLAWLREEWTAEWWGWLLPVAQIRQELNSREKRLLSLLGIFTFIVGLGLFSPGMRNFSPLLVLTLTLLLILVYPLLILAAAAILRPVEQRLTGRQQDRAQSWLKALPGLELIALPAEGGRLFAAAPLIALLRDIHPAQETPEQYNSAAGLGQFLRKGMKAGTEVLLCGLQAAAALRAPRVAVLDGLDSLAPADGNGGSAVKSYLAALPPRTTVVINGDQERLRELAGGFSGRVVSYGFGSHNDIRVTGLRFSRLGSYFALWMKGQVYPLNTPLLGQGHIRAVMASVAVATELGLDPERLWDMLHDMEPLAGFLSLSEREGRVFIDNSGPGIKGLEQTLDMLAVFDCERRCVAVAGQAGADENTRERELQLGAHIARVCDLIILVGLENSMALREGAIKAGYPPEKLFMASDQAVARLLLTDFTRPGDAVLLCVDLGEESPAEPEPEAEPDTETEQ